MTGKRILVTYSAQLGSAPEIAKEIGNELQKAGHAAEVADMKNVPSLENYRAVVMGVPVYAGFAGLGEIGNFAKRRFSEDLARMPVALFAIGLVYEGTKIDDGFVLKNLNNAITPLVPVSTAHFCGVVDENKLGFWQRFGNITKIPSGDFQDWDKIRAWARELPGLLKV
jgi:menaquinone-dependent protoporphyrinogen oxidase